MPDVKWEVTLHVNPTAILSNHRLTPLQQNNTTINHQRRLLGGSSGGPGVLIGGEGDASSAPN